MDMNWNLFSANLLQRRKILCWRFSIDTHLSSWNETFHLLTVLFDRFGYYTEHLLQCGVAIESRQQLPVSANNSLRDTTKK